MELRFRQEPNGRYILAKRDIELIADYVLRKYFPGNLEKAVPLNTEKLFEELGLLVRYEYLGLPDHRILGVTVMGDEEEIVGCDARLNPTILEAGYGTVLIHSSLCCVKEAPRRRYTEAHEISHWLLHRPFFERLPQQRQIACRSVERYGLKVRTERDWLEWQADSLAAAMLMPRDTFCGYAKAAIRAAGAAKGYLVEGRPEDRRVFEAAAERITKRYFVSRRAAEIRMIELGLIKTM